MENSGQKEPGRLPLGNHVLHPGSRLMRQHNGKFLQLGLQKSLPGSHRYRTFLLLHSARLFPQLTTCCQYRPLIALHSKLLFVTEEFLLLRVRKVTEWPKAKPDKRPIPLNPLSLWRCFWLREIGTSSRTARSHDKPGPLSRIVTRRPLTSSVISTFPLFGSLDAAIESAAF